VPIYIRVICHVSGTLPLVSGVRSSLYLIDLTNLVFDQLSSSFLLKELERVILVGTSVVNSEPF
jgi:hypothetical protein